MGKVPVDLRLSAVTAYYMKEISKGNQSPAAYIGFPDRQIEEAAAAGIDRFVRILELPLVKTATGDLNYWSLNVEGLPHPITWTTTGKSNVENLAAMLVHLDLAKGSRTAPQK